MIGISMGLDTNKIIECYSCGLFVKKEKKQQSTLHRCPRCNSKLLIENDGIKSLGLKHNPRLEKKYYQLGMGS